MAKINTRPTPNRTHEGATAKRIDGAAQLRRSVMACLLWERQFYEQGESIATRIIEGVRNVDPSTAAEIAIEARTDMNLRHVPLLITVAIAHEHRSADIARLIPQVVQRADELAELVALQCWINGVKPSRAKKVLPAAMKRGLAAAFPKFDAYQLAKYNRDGEVKLRDVLFLCHAKPRSKDQEQVWAKLVRGTLPAPDTWEVALSEGGDPKTEFERLLTNDRLGYMALLRNLRKMAEAGVERRLIHDAIRARKGAGRVLPFRFTAAARAAPQFERVLDEALVASIEEQEPMPGMTLVLVDVSGSMNAPLSSRSDLNRRDAAATLGAMVPGDVRLFSFSRDLVEVPARKGMAGVDAIIRSQPHGGTDLGGAIRAVNAKVAHDRLIVITDEQSHTRVPDPAVASAYMINVASYRNGVGYGKWTHIDGFSEAVLRYIRAAEGV